MGSIPLPSGIEVGYPTNCGWDRSGIAVGFHNFSMGSVPSFIHSFLRQAQAIKDGARRLFFDLVVGEKRAHPHDGELKAACVLQDGHLSRLGRRFRGVAHLSRLAMEVTELVFLERGRAT